MSKQASKQASDVRDEHHTPARDKELNWYLNVITRLIEQACSEAISRRSCNNRKGISKRECSKLYSPRKKDLKLARETATEHTPAKKVLHNILSDSKR